MLTKELLEVTKRKPNINPRYRDIDEYRSVAEQVIEAYQPGETQGEIKAAIADLETHDTFKLVRGLSKLLDRRCTFEQRAPMSPARLRDAVFEHGFVTDADERSAVLATVASEHELTPAEVENGLWADRPDQEVLTSRPEIGATKLLRQYNLSLTQTLLFDAVELEFTASGNYQEFFGLLKYLGLMYRVDNGEQLTVTVTGPAALFKKTRKYGTTLAKLLPSIMKAEEWLVSAQVETEVSDETRIYEFSLDDSQEDVFPAQKSVESFDSEVERDFATRIDSLADGWTVTREPTILRTGTRVMIPDFSFERDRGQPRDDDDTRFYLEVVGFWTPEYLAEKLAKVRDVESEYPLMLAVNEELNCTAEDFEEANVDQVFFYDDTIPVKPVLARLHAIENQRVQEDLQRLDDIDIPTDAVTAIDALADEHGVEPDAIRQRLEGNEIDSGVISNGNYVPEAVLATIKTEIDALESPTLADVTPIVERYDVAQNIVEEVGYTIQYTSLNQDEAAVREAP